MAKHGHKSRHNLCSHLPGLMIQTINSGGVAMPRHLDRDAGGPLVIPFMYVVSSDGKTGMCVLGIVDLCLRKTFTLVEAQTLTKYLGQQTVRVIGRQAS